MLFYSWRDWAQFSNQALRLISDLFSMRGKLVARFAASVLPQPGSD
jgi:hypothetical protein